MADCIGTGFPQFPCALVQMRYSIGENGCGHIFMGGERGNSGGKEGRWLCRWGRKWRKGQGKRKGRRRKGDKVGDMLKASCHTGGNTNKKKYKTWLFNIELRNDNLILIEIRLNPRIYWLKIVTRFEKMDLRSKSENLHGDERLKKSKPLRTRSKTLF